VPAQGRVEAIYLGSPGRGSLELHLMHARLEDEEPRSLAPLNPTASFPDVWRPSVAGDAVAWWDGRSDPGGVRLQAIGDAGGDGEAVTVAGGAARWPHLARQGDDGLRLTFVRPPGEVRTMVVDTSGGVVRAEHVVAVDDQPERPAQAAGAWVWLDPSGAVRLLESEGEPDGQGTVETIDPFGMPGLDLAAVEVVGRPVVAWTRKTFEGPQVVVWSPAAGAGARVLGPGAGPVATVGNPGVAMVFDRGGFVHFASGVCD
jgi:hypothetical protein